MRKTRKIIAILLIFSFIFAFIPTNISKATASYEIVFNIASETDHIMTMEENRLKVDGQYVEPRLASNPEDSSFNGYTIAQKTNGDYVYTITNGEDVVLNFNTANKYILRSGGQIVGADTTVFSGTTPEKNNVQIEDYFEPAPGNGPENPGQQPVGGPDDISFDLTWKDTYVLVNINDKEVLGDSDAQQDTFKFNNIVVENAGEADENKTNVIKLQNRFGDHEVSEITINGVKYDKNSNDVEITEFGWMITVPGASKYVISATGDRSIAIPKTIIWANPDYVPENAEDAEWVSNFTISHGIAKVVEVYDENNKLLNSDEYTGEDADKNGLDKGFGWVKIMPGSRVVFEFVPEYGYQLTGIAINETPLDAVDSNTNRFEIKLPNEDAGNLHFSATFTKTEDIVKANSKKIASGSISLGNELDAGSAQLTVSDVQLSEDKIKGFEKAAGDYEIKNYLDIDLYQVFYKGKEDSDDVWSNKIDTLDKEATITLKLEDGVHADDIVLVHNIHDGEEYEIIKIDSYDSTTNTITFKAKSFSNYAIATKGNNVVDTTSSSTDTNTTAVEKTSNNPTTGDNIVTVITIFAIATLGVCTTIKINRNRKIRKH